MGQLEHYVINNAPGTEMIRPIAEPISRAFLWHSAGVANFLRAESAFSRKLVANPQSTKGTPALHRTAPHRIAAEPSSHITASSGQQCEHVATIQCTPSRPGSGCGLPPLGAVSQVVPVEPEVDGFVGQGTTHIEQCKVWRLMIGISGSH